MSVIWPRALLRPRDASIDIAPATIAGPAALSGFRQAVASPAGLWSIRYHGFIVASPVQRKVWRALAAQIEGRATPIVLPVWDRSDLRPASGGAAAVAPHGDGALMSDGSGFASAATSVVLASAVARGAVRMTTTTVIGGAIEPGMHFSVGLRLYRVKAIEAAAGASTTFTFWPRARDTMLAGAEAVFDQPVCKVRLADDAGLDLMLDHGRHAFPDVAFIEDVS